MRGTQSPPDLASSAPACRTIPQMPIPATVARFLCLAALFALAGAARADELRDAVDRVRQETGGYILSAQSLKTHGGTVHRVKVLTRDGRVEVRQIAAGLRGEPLGFTHGRGAGAGTAGEEAPRLRERWREDGSPGDDERRRVRQRLERERPAWADDRRPERRGTDMDGPRSVAPSRELPAYGRDVRGFERPGVEALRYDDAPADRPPDRD